MCKVIGIDVSKETLDASFLKKDTWKYYHLSNDKKGFKRIAGFIEEGGIAVMEASGPYYLPLAMYLYEQGIKVCVENPLVIKRYSQMRMNRAKTDKKDAQVIAQYGMTCELRLWSPGNEKTMKIKQLYTAVQLLQKQKHQTKMQLDSFNSSGILDPTLKKELKSTYTHLENKIKKMEGQIVKQAKEAYADTIKYLQSIPGIGIKTAILLTVITDNFTRFEHYKQLIAYVGFSPRIYQSGTSVKGKGHICKMGNSLIRKYLYLGSWAAKKHNKTCVEMYERLIAKGKPERVVKIAIANKLLKQAFAIGKNKTMFDENYSPKVCF